MFRRKLLITPWTNDEPYWVDDPRFDLEYHVRHIALPKPGDWRQFCIQLARLHARSLDMRRPLWEATVIEGLSNVDGLPPKAFAIVLKLHHAAIDGMSGAEILAAIHSLTPEFDPTAAVPAWQPETPPPRAEIYRRAYINNWRRPIKFAETLANLIPANQRIKALDTPQTESAKPVTTRFNARITEYRVVDGLRLQLADVKTIKAAVPDATINDVVVAIVGGAMRYYLQDKNELPKTTLYATVPINARSSDDQAGGNKVSNMTLALASDVAAPLARVAAVHQAAVESKAYSNALGVNMMADMMQSVSPAVVATGLKAAAWLALRGNLAVPLNTTVSNVPGPQYDMYLAGARVDCMMGMGPLLDYMGLFHVVISGAGKITITFVSCREILPDPQFYAQCLKRAFDEMFAAASKKHRSKMSGTTATKAKAKAKAKAKSVAKPRVKAKAKTRAR